MFKIRELSDLKVMPDDELMAYVLESERELKPLTIYHNDLLAKCDDLRFNVEISKQDVVHGFEFNPSEQKYGYPWLDERENGLFETQVNGGYRVPGKGFYWFVGPRLSVKRLGVVVVDFVIGKMVRNGSDWRFVKDEKPDLLEQNNFYYDYESKTYIQLTVAEPWKKKNKKEAPEKTKAQENLEEYNRRIECLSYIDNRMGRIEENYGLGLHIAAEDFYLMKSKSPVDTGEFNNLFKVYEEFYEKYFEPFFHVKLMLSHVSLVEYEMIVKHSNELLETIKQMNKKIDLFLNKVKRSEVNFVEEEFKYDEDAGILFNQLRNVVAKITNYFALRPFHKSKKDEDKKMMMRGYIAYDDERLYPTIRTIEQRRSLTEFPMKQSEWQAYERKLLTRLNKQKGDDEKVAMTLVGKLYGEDIEEYKKLLNLRKTNPSEADSVLMYKCRASGVAPSDIKLYLEDLRNKPGARE